MKKILLITINIDSFPSMLRSMRKRKNIVFILLLVVCCLSFVYGAETVDLYAKMTHTFQTGDSIFAKELNINFKLLYDKTNKLIGAEENVGLKAIYARIDAIQTNIVDLFGGFQENIDLVLANNIIDLDKGLDNNIILIWHGKLSDMPDAVKDKWDFCDGSNDTTPDLRKKFVVGAEMDDVNASVQTIYPNDDADAGTLINVNESADPGHNHGMAHYHTPTVKEGGAHTHTWATLAYISNYWTWKTYTNNGSLDDRPFEKIINKPNGVGLASVGDTMFGLTINTAISPQLGTSDSQVHKHGILRESIKSLPHPYCFDDQGYDHDCNTATVPVSQKVSAYPPYYALPFVMKK